MSHPYEEYDALQSEARSDALLVLRYIAKGIQPPGTTAQEYAAKEIARLDATMKRGHDEFIKAMQAMEIAKVPVAAEVRP